MSLGQTEKMKLYFVDFSLVRKTSFFSLLKKFQKTKFDNL